MAGSLKTNKGIPYASASLERLYGASPVAPLDERDSYIVFSDLHLGNGGPNDDFKANSRLFLAALRTYYQRGYKLILNGDIEELQKFSLASIEKTWNQLYQLFTLFHEQGRLIKIYGNHDAKLATQTNLKFPVQEGQILRYHGRDIFFFHGHQTRKVYVEGNDTLEFLIRYMLNPLGIGNKSASHDSKKKYLIERLIYEFSSKKALISVIGHTHRPLFESMSRLDTVRFEIERLCRKYPKVGGGKQAELEQRITTLGRELSAIIERGQGRSHGSTLYSSDLLVPCIFNSGTVISKEGLTGIEIKRGTIALIHWFTPQQRQKGRAWQKGPVVDEASGNFRAVVKREPLDYVFNRVSLLGGAGV